MGLSLRIAEFALGFQWKNLSEGRRQKARWFVADYIGSTLAGSTLPEAASGFVLAQPGAVKLPGDSRGLTPESAAVAMGTLGALLQIHDGFGGGGNHPSSSIIPALWASRGGKPLAEFLLPAAVGYEIACRIAKCSHPAQTLAGAAPTSTTGAIGAAVAVGKLLRLDKRTLADAVSIAAFTVPVAAMRALTEHGSVVPIHGGLAARAALEAVRLAQAGLAAGENVLEGGKDSGLLQLLRGDAASLAPETWRGDMLDGVYFKPLPACRHAQPAIEAVLDIISKGSLDFRKIQNIKIHTYPMALMFGQPPRESHELYDRLMSMPWAIASCLVHGGFSFDNVTAPARDPRIEGLYSRISSASDPDFEKEYPKRFITRIDIEMQDGTTRTGECRMEYGMPSESGPYSPRGTTTPPLDEAGMRRKFFDLACRRISRDEAEKILNEIFERELAT
ncbi:MAG: MmgE/PrpD family protein [Betaproteobacteria bacterium]|nr:MmgE/PrpD family protein [Betaproteobacteria bacterium]